MKIIRFVFVLIILAIVDISIMELLNVPQQPSIIIGYAIGSLGVLFSIDFIETGAWFHGSRNSKIKWKFYVASKFIVASRNLSRFISNKLNHFGIFKCGKSNPQ